MAGSARGPPSILRHRPQWRPYAVAAKPWQLAAVILPLSPVSSLAPNLVHTICLPACSPVCVYGCIEDGLLLTFGWNRYGQLGHGSTVNALVARGVVIDGLRVESVSLGNAHTLILAGTRCGYLVLKLTTPLG